MSVEGFKAKGFGIWRTVKNVSFYPAVWLCVFAFFPMHSFAEGKGLPLAFVLSQIFNFSLFVLALFFLLRKKIPDFLRQKHRDFVEYRKKALELEKSRRANCLLWREKVRALEEKNLSQAVEKALNNLRKELSLREETELKTLKIKMEREIKRLKIKTAGRLKNRILSLALKGAKKELQKRKNVPEKLNYQSVQKWGRM